MKGLEGGGKEGGRRPRCGEKGMGVLEGEKQVIDR